MAEPKNPITPERVQATRDEDFARADARRAMRAKMKAAEPTLPMTQQPLFAPVVPITQGSVGPRNKHILDSLLPGEPIFIFRAKDILSTMVLNHYATLLETYSPYSEITEDTVDKINEFREWQHAHPADIKLPD